MKNCKISLVEMMDEPDDGQTDEATMGEVEGQKARR